MKVLYKLVVLIGIVCVQLAGAILIWVCTNDQMERKSRLAFWTHYLAEGILNLLGLRYWIEVRAKQLPSSSALVVANHVSYLDVLLLAALQPTVFITSNEVRDSFLIGWIARASGAVFVERRNNRTLAGEVSKVSDILKAGINVGLFPEGTSTNGQDVKAFRSSIFESAIQAKVSIFPVCLNYQTLDAERIHTGSSRSLFYYGEMNIFVQILRLLMINTAWVELLLLSPVEIQKESNRKELSYRTYRAIREVYLPIRFVESTVESAEAYLRPVA